MPGLKQLKQFNADLLNLGDEVKIRAARGEKPVTVPIPKDIPDIDDSEDFVNGMPVSNQEELEQAEAAASELEDDVLETSATGAKAPDVSDLLAPSADNLDDIDLSDFENPGSLEDVEEAEAVPLEDMDLDSLLSAASDADESEDSNTVSDADIAPMDDSADLSGLADIEDLNQEEEKDDFNSQLDQILEEKSKKQESEEVPFDIEKENESFMQGVDSSVDMNEGIPEQFIEIPDDPQIGNDAFQPIDENTDENAVDDLSPEESADLFGEPVSDESPVEETASEDLPPLPEEESAEPTEASNEDLFNTDDIDSLASEAVPDQEKEEKTEESAGDSESEETSAEPSTEDIFNTDDMDSMENADSFELPDMDMPAESSSDETVSTDSADDDFSLPDSPDMFSSDDADSSETIEQFDTSDMEGMDGSDFELGNITASEGDDDIFSIPGFSDTDSEHLDLRKKPKVATPDFSGAVEAADANKPKNTFTDAEYRVFQKNLAEYPLNVRIALEDIVVKNELTDDALFEVLEMVLRKVPARQLASKLEKMMDIQLDVPRDFEMRTASEYEAYKQSVEYKLKNQIIPGAILSTLAAILVFCIFVVVKTFIYDPIMANNFYKEGYALIQKDEYKLSEESFNEALTYKQVKKWFYRYAESYREHKQYERARMMYRNLLARYNHDKKAGLDWAKMESNDLMNYPDAERILKREVLDYHINDPDAILALGDNYLDWADSGQTDKYPLAKEQYDLLMQLYGNKSSLYDKFAGRQMRYYIRTDNLAQVLNFKQYFYPKKLKNLEPGDLTELSGYLLDKRYGTLRPSEESLRLSIENVRGLLEEAVKRDPGDPVALYNMGRYFVQTRNGSAAKSLFNSALNSFKAKKVRSFNDMHKYINTYRMLGEELSSEGEYIQAQKIYAEGIDLYENEKKMSDRFESTENVGLLYADMGDIYYFKDGDMDSALSCYTKSIDSKNDVPSIRYRIGYIQYKGKKYSEALGSFVRGAEDKPSDTHMLLALANTLSLRNDDHAAQGYYDKLINILDNKKQVYKIILPQVNKDQGDLVDTYMKAANNLGVTLSRIAEKTGDSQMNGRAIVSLNESLRAWDALTRNQETMIRLPASNLAEQNIKYITNPAAQFNPEIYTEIPMLLEGEMGLD